MKMTTEDVMWVGRLDVDRGMEIEGTFFID